MFQGFDGINYYGILFTMILQQGDAIIHCGVLLFTMVLQKGDAISHCDTLSVTIGFHKGDAINHCGILLFTIDMVLQKVDAICSLWRFGKVTLYIHSLWCFSKVTPYIHPGASKRWCHIYSLWCFSNVMPYIHYGVLERWHHVFTMVFQKEVISNLGFLCTVNTKLLTSETPWWIYGVFTMVTS